MPITTLALPASAAHLSLPESGRLFLAFIASNHPDTGESWCPDVRAALPPINAAFAASDAPALAFVEVGQRPEWKEPGNAYRTAWGVHNVPALVRYERVGGAVAETGRLVEGEILDAKRLGGFIQ